jgi:hypothetical protein
LRLCLFFARQLIGQTADLVTAGIDCCARQPDTVVGGGQGEIPTALGEENVGYYFRNTILLSSRRSRTVPLKKSEMKKGNSVRKTRCLI